MSRSAVGFHFATKDGLLSAVMDDVTTEVAEAYDLIDLDAPLDQVVDAFCRPLRDSPELLRILCMFIYEVSGPTPNLKPKVVSRYHELLDVLGTALEHLAQRGTIAPRVSSQAGATLLVALVCGYAFDDTDLRHDGFYDELRASLLAYLKP